MTRIGGSRRHIEVHATERKRSRFVRLFVLSVCFSLLRSVRLFVRLARLPRWGGWVRGCAVKAVYR